MIKIKATYADPEEKEKLIESLEKEFNVAKVSKEYKKEGPLKRIHIDLKNK